MFLSQRWVSPHVSCVSDCQNKRQKSPRQTQQTCQCHRDVTVLEVRTQRYVTLQQHTHTHTPPNGSICVTHTHIYQGALLHTPIKSYLVPLSPIPTMSTAAGRRDDGGGWRDAVTVETEGRISLSLSFSLRKPLSCHQSVLSRRKNLHLSCD